MSRMIVTVNGHLDVICEYRDGRLYTIPMVDNPTRNAILGLFKEIAPVALRERRYDSSLSRAI